MWLEAILSKQDLEGVLRELTPTRIDLSEDGELYLGAPTSVTLVPGRGLRVVSPAKLRWTLLGLHVPITIESATVLLEPVVRRVVGRGDVLAFQIQVEALSVTAMPDFFEGTAVERVNAELTRGHAELVWDFSETLSHRFDLPSLLQPTRRLDVRVAWGEARIGEDAIVLAVSVHVHALTQEAPAPTPTLALAIIPTRTKRVTAVSRTSVAVMSSVAAFSITALGFAIGTLIAHRRRSVFGLLLA
jgi:hypothetical protein